MTIFSDGNAAGSSKANGWEELVMKIIFILAWKLKFLSWYISFFRSDIEVFNAVT